MYISGSAAHFTDSFPISPRQPLRKKTLKVDTTTTTNDTMEKVENEECESNTANNARNPQDSDKNKVSAQPSPERQCKNSRSHIDRAKPRKSPCRPLPGMNFVMLYVIFITRKIIPNRNIYPRLLDIVTRLAQSSSESEIANHLDTENIPADVTLIEQELEIDFTENLLAFQDTVPRYMKNKKARRQRKKTKKDGELLRFVRLWLLFSCILE